MTSDLSSVRAIQALDHRIDALTKEIEGLPRHVAAIRARLAEHERELQRTRDVLAENAKEIRQLEGQVGDNKSKISHLQDQMNEAKTNEQYRAFQHEIDFCKSKVDEIEERILDRMERSEALQESASKAEADLKVETAKVEQDVEKARERIEGDQHERAECQQKREAETGKVGPVALQTYERVRKAHGTAIAPVLGANCGSCHVRLRPKLLQDLRLLEQGVLTCEGCGLIVYLPEPAEGEGAPLEDPATDMAPAAGSK